jgi:uncharacterized membrane protein
MMATLVLGDRRAALDLGLLALLVAAAGLSVAQIQPLCGPVVLLAMSLVPGAAFLTRVTARDPLATVALALGLSLAVDTAVATAMAWTGWWHPQGAAAAVAAMAAALLLADLRRALTDSQLGAAG